MSVSGSRSAVVAGLVTTCLLAVGCIVPVDGAPNCPVMPNDSYWQADVRSLPVHERSDDWVSSIGLDRVLKADFGSGEWDGGPIGIPYTTVGADQTPVDVSFDYDDESDPGPYPIPTDAPIEGGADSDGDRHVIVVDRDACRLYETWNSHPQADGSWHAGSGAVFDLRSNDLRPAGWTSADAAGLPILPGLVRYEEVEAGRIGHAIRFTVPRSQRAYVWPATHFASTSTDPTRPPMGAWFRLKADVDPSGFSEQTRPIVEALKTHGMIVADNGSPWYLSGVPDERWDNDLLRELGTLDGGDFEAIDTSGLMVEPGSGQRAH